MSAQFCETILNKKVILFLKESGNLLEPDEICFLHDSAPWFHTNELQKSDEGLWDRFFFLFFINLKGFEVYWTLTLPNTLEQS